MSTPLPPPTLAQPAPQRRKGLRWWGIAAIAIAGVAGWGVIGVVGGDKNDPLEPDAQTCTNLQRAVNGGMTKREAINLAIAQVGEPDLDSILRVQLRRCDITE